MDGVIIAGKTMIPARMPTATVCGSRQQVPDPDQQPHLHADRPAAPPADHGPEHTRQVFLHLGDGHSPVPESPATPRHGLLIGESGLTSALHEIGYMLTERDPDYVVLGETELIVLTGSPAQCAWWRWEHVYRHQSRRERAVRGRRPRLRSHGGADRKGDRDGADFVGKPNPLMMRTALRYLGEHSENAIMVGTAWTPTSSPASRAAWRPSWC